MSYTPEQIRSKIETDQKWLERAILAVYAKQTAHEQHTDSTEELNGVGFSGADARFLSKCASWLQKGNHLNGWFVEEARRRMPKYSKQLAAIANNNAPAKAETPASSKIVMEASELGWQPGYAPRAMVFGGGVYHMTEAHVTPGEEIASWQYENVNTGQVLVVLND